MIKVFTDGSCIGNPGPGGWAAIILNKKIEKLLSGQNNNTTNNQMELLATIKALEYFKHKESFIIFTDSKYVKDGITKWIKNWEKNNWKTASRTAVKNQELWRKLNQLVNFHNVKWQWIKGHSTNKYNNLADKLARSAAENK